MVPHRFLISVFLTFGLLGLASGQSVRDIRAIEEGNTIQISYGIEDSHPSQFFYVTLTCHMEDGTTIEPRAVRGDIGHQIPGGEREYTIVWEVDQNQQQAGVVTYEIKAELERDLDLVTSPLPVTSEQPYRIVEPGNPQPTARSAQGNPILFVRRMSVAYNGSLSSPYGMSVGTIRNWGFYTSFRFGGQADDWQRDVWFTAMAGPTKYILGNDLLRMHGYAGIGITVEAYEEYIYNTERTDSFFSMETGLTGIIGFLSVTLGVDYVLTRGADLVFGIGFVF